MNISDILSDSIKYPSSDWGKVLILGIIGIASILIVPIFLLMGYIFRIIKATLAGLDELPEFDEIGEMFVDGLKIFVVAIVYAIPVYIIALIIGLIFNTGLNTTTSIGLDPMMFWGLFAAYLVYIIVALIIGLIEVIAIVNMAYYDGELGAAFRFSEILEHIARIGWGKYIATYIVVAIIAFIGYLIGVLTFFILIGIILLPLVIVPYITMFGSRAIALLFAYSGEPEAIEEAPAEEAPVE
jgi:ABC-type transport system involved in multi-copper enzyme maturation permease subunit